MCSHFLSPAHTVLWMQHLHILSCGYKTCTHCHVDTRPAHTVVWLQDLHTLSCGYKTCTHCHVDTRPAHTVIWIQVQCYLDRCGSLTWKHEGPTFPKVGWSLIRVLLMGGCGRQFCVSNTGQTTKLPSVANTKMSATPTLNYWLLLLFLWHNSHACIRCWTVTLCVNFVALTLPGSENGDENYSALPDHVMQPSAAVLLSPVVRKTRVQEESLQEALKPSQLWSLLSCLCHCACAIVQSLMNDDNLFLSSYHFV